MERPGEPEEGLGAGRGLFLVDDEVEDSARVVGLAVVEGAGAELFEDGEVARLLFLVPLEEVGGLAVARGVEELAALPFQLAGRLGKGFRRRNHNQRDGQRFGKESIFRHEDWMGTRMARKKHGWTQKNPVFIRAFSVSSVFPSNPHV